MGIGLGAFFQGTASRMKVFECIRMYQLTNRNWRKLVTISREEKRRFDMKNLKKIVAEVMMAVLLVSLFPITSYADTNNIVNTCTAVSSEQADMIYEMISESIVRKYAGIYDFDSFQFTFSNQKIGEEVISADVNVTANMTLIKNPKDSQYVKGMEAAIEEIEDENKILAATDRMEEYLDQVMSCYNETISVGYEYQVNFPNSTTMMERTVQDEIVVFHKIETESGSILSEVDLNDKFDEEGNYEAGKDDIVQSIKEPKAVTNAARSVSYNPSQAAAYAFAHATDKPQYYKEGNSDCANFVSKCIHAGGIPEDKSGGWYQDSLIWIRTGYGNKDGVVPYMVRKGYFASTSSSSKVTLGSIMYWNNKSHVALVSRIDGYSIYYSHHSDEAKANRYYQYSSRTDDVTFYVPKV